MNDTEAALYATWRAAVLEHERMCIAVDLYTPPDVYAEYLAARTAEIEAALALRAGVAPLGLGVSAPTRNGRMAARIPREDRPVAMMTCPGCGAKMRTDGTCPDCGYQKKGK